MAQRLFATKDRAASHAKLAEILAAGEHPRAECREDVNTGEFSVWDDAEPWVPVAPSQPALEVSDAVLDALADRVAKRMKKGR